MSVHNNNINGRLISFMVMITFIISTFLILIKPGTAIAQTVIHDLSKSSEYAKPAISTLLERKVISGDENGNFNPEENVTRAQMVAFVVKAAGYDITNVGQTPTFTDVAADNWAYPYVETAVKKGIIQGTEPGKFSPDSFCTREQATKILINSVKNNRIALNNSADEMLARLQKFNDFNKISDWAVDYLSIAVNLGLINGTSDTTISPTDLIKREQMAVIIDRFINNFLGKLLSPDFIYLTGTEELLDFSIDLVHVSNLKIRKIVADDGSEVPYTVKYSYKADDVSESTDNPDQYSKFVQVKIDNSSLNEGHTYKVIFSFIYPHYYAPGTLHTEEIIFYELPVNITKTLIPRASEITLGTTFYEVRRIMNIRNNYVDKDQYLIKNIDFTDGSTITGKLTDGKYLVIGWENKGSLKVSIGDKVENAAPVQVGSTIQEVIRALGTPDIIKSEIYGSSWTYSNIGKVLFNHSNEVFQYE